MYAGDLLGVVFLAYYQAYAGKGLAVALQGCFGDGLRSQALRSFVCTKATTEPRTQDDAADHRFSNHRLGYGGAWRCGVTRVGGGAWLVFPHRGDLCENGDGDFWRSLASNSEADWCMQLGETLCRDI